MISTSRNRRRSIDFQTIINSKKYLIKLSIGFTTFIILSLLVTYHFSNDEAKNRNSFDLGRVIGRNWDVASVQKQKGIRFKAEHHPKTSKKAPSESLPTILILTPMKNSLEHVWHYFQMLDTLSYPRELIQIGILVSDSTDGTFSRALELADERQYTHKAKGIAGRGKYGKISILSKDFALEEENVKFNRKDDEDFEKDQIGLSNIGKARHAFSLQIPRRKLLAQSRSWLLSSTLSLEVDHVLWLDVDVIEYQEDLIQILLGWMGKESADVVVPNCMWKSYNEMGGYDLNNWAETDESLAHKATLKPNDILIEGYPSHPTYRLPLISLYPITSRTPPSIILDGVGGCTTLVKAEFHRMGAIFPTWPVDHQIETEGFAQIVKRLGGKIIGLSGVYVYHGLYG